MEKHSFSHTSVLLDETVANVLTDRAGIYVDCTLGGGGHSAALGRLLEPQALLLGIDQDEAALSAAKEKLKDLKCGVLFKQGNFNQLASFLAEEGIGKINGIIFDLGVSSYQLDTPERGFSYMQNGPLDMRMNIGLKLTAQEIVNSYTEAKLAEIISAYGEERWAKRIAQFIISEREKKPLQTTYELVETIKKAIPKGARKDGPHPAKRTFQALRIEVNQELAILEKAFIQAAEHLKVDGRLAIITFHSLEDRIAKNTLRTLAQKCICPPQLPICVCKKEAVLKDIKVIKPSISEIESNPRARSAKLRVATRR